MRPIGIHISYWQTNWSDALIPLIARAKAAGYDGAELPLLDPGNFKVAETRAALADYGMRCTCGTGLNPGADITSPDAALRKAGLAHLQACLHIAAALGSPILGGVTYASWGVFPQGDLAAYRARCIRSLREAGTMAGDLGIHLCLEVLNRFEGYLINTVEQGLALLDEVGSPYLKLHLDSFHMNIEESDLAGAIRKAGAQIGHFHCSENNRACPGVGSIPWPAVGRALADANYRGWLVVESFTNPAGEVGRGTFVWHKPSANLDREAAWAAEFVRQEVDLV